MLAPTLFPYLLSISLLGSYVVALPAPQVPVTTFAGGRVLFFRPVPTPTIVVHLEEPAHSTKKIRVDTITKPDSTIQLPNPPKRTPPGFRNLGFVNTELDTRGNPSIVPFPTGDPRTIGTTDTQRASGTTYTTPIEVVETIVPLLKRKAEAKAEAEDGGDHLNFLPVRQNVANLFTPIDTTAPWSGFSLRNNHPVPLPVTSGTTSSTAYQTNKFYANIMIGSRNNPVFTYPYEVWWSNKQGDPWGLGIDHREPEQRQFGAPEGPAGANRWYSNPIWIRSLQLGAKEFKNGYSTLELANFGIGSIDLSFYADPSLSRTKKMDVTLVQGMGFVSATYNGITPVLDSVVWVRSLVKVAGFRTGATKHVITLENDSVWVLYSFPASGTQPLELQVINEGHVEANSTFTGLIQIAKLSKTTTGYSAVELVHDQAAGGWCKSVTMAASVQGSTGYYQFNYQRQGSGSSELLMWALPHHLKSFSSVTLAKTKTSLNMWSPTKGIMTGVVANQWQITESGLPTNIGWLPVKSSGTATFSAANLNMLSYVAKTELTQDFSNVTNLDTMYFGGKAMAKYAFLCLSMSEVLKDSSTTKQCLAKLKTAFDRYAKNTQQNKLVYDTKWKGLLSDAMFKTGDLLADFGSGMYNDHHFHYGYFIEAAAIIGYLDKKYVSTTGAWLSANKRWVNTLVRDVANPSSSDTYFPVFRSFDWFHGHSWAKGLFESWDGKDEESSSEDYNFAYGMKLWGNVIGDAAMEARGNLMLAIMKRSMNLYMLIDSDNTIHPPSFIGNKVSGILFENKVDHTTYFGNLPQYIQGIHMLPLTAISPYMRGLKFMTEEWNLYFKGKTTPMDDGWKGILWANYAMIDAVTSFKWFISPIFTTRWLDGGASRTWYMAFSGALGGAA